MRAAAFRIGLVAVLFLAGCATATKREYLRHLSVSIAPVRPGAPATGTATAMGSSASQMTAEANASPR